MIDKNQKCKAYFKGIDSLGTCDTECVWYNIECLNGIKRKK